MQSLFVVEILFFDKRFVTFMVVDNSGSLLLNIIIIIIIINDNVYGAVIVTMVTARVHPVHLMNAD